jgi:hypothetical protein
LKTIDNNPQFLVGIVLQIQSDEIVPLVGFAVVSIYGFAAPWILPPSGNTDPDAGEIVAERGQLI